MRNAHRFCVLWMGVLGSGCVPLTPLLPFAVLETPAVLPRFKVSLAASGGAGMLRQEGWGSGANLRVRMGVGARQEVGVEGGVIYTNTGEARGSRPPWYGANTAIGGRLTWKGAPLPFLALLAGAGAASAITGAALGGDLGVVLSTPRDLGGVFRPYLAARALFALPVGRPLEESGGPTLGLVLPAGASFNLGRFVRFALELGPIGAWSNVGADAAQFEQPAYRDMLPYRLYYGPGSHVGFYGAAGLSFVIDRGATDQAGFLRALQIWYGGR